MNRYGRNNLRQGNGSIPRQARRAFLYLGVGFALPIAIPSFLSCTKQNLLVMKTSKQSSSVAAGRLRARPTQPTETGSPGLQSLNLDGQRDGLIYVPATYQGSQPISMLLMLHGAGGDAEGALRIIQKWADTFSIIVLAVDSRNRTWDVIINGYGPDITFIDQALAQLFNRYAINSSQLAIGGFSDGASYALSVGITNGDLFTHILAFSPGFMAPAAQVGQPRVFISHGTEDTVLPINRCSRRIVPQLQQSKYDVLYREFSGGHTVPNTIAQEAMQWFTTH